MSKNFFEFYDMRTLFSVGKFSEMLVAGSIPVYLINLESLYFNNNWIGEIILDNDLVTGGMADGNYATNLMVLGDVEGNIYLQEKLTFRSWFFSKGKILFKMLIISGKVFFNANVSAILKGEVSIKHLQWPSNIGSKEYHSISNSLDGEDKPFFFRHFFKINKFKSLHLNRFLKLNY
jgi:hypothetical protein